MGVWPDQETQDWILARMMSWPIDYVESLPNWKRRRGLLVLSNWDAGLREQ